MRPTVADLKSRISIETLVGRYLPLKAAGKLYKGHCPWHTDEHPSFEVTPRKGAAFCNPCGLNLDHIAFLEKIENLTTAEAILRLAEIVGVDMSPPKPEPKNGKPKGKLVATYTYTDAAGNYAFTKLRFLNPDGSKALPQGHYQGKKWINGLDGLAEDTTENLYNLPAVAAAIAAGTPILLNEGEKACDTEIERGHVATCTRLGATGLADTRPKWHKRYTGQLAGAHLTIIEDNDAVGHHHASIVYWLVKDSCASVRLVRSATTGAKDDGFEHFDPFGAALGVDELVPVEPEPFAEPIECEIELPEIITNRQFKAVTADAIAALLAANDPPTMFHRGRHLVRIDKDPRGRHSIIPICDKMLRTRLGMVATWIKVADKKTTNVYPPLEIATNILTFSEPIPGVPSLSGLSSVPILGPSGVFYREHGYDSDSEWFVTSRELWEHWDGSPQDAAKWIASEVFVDFPFDSPASLANAFGLMLLPLVRPIINGPTPFHFADAPRSRAGKGLLLDACLMPTIGERNVVRPLPATEEEKSKTLYSLLLQGEQVIMFDNVKGNVDSQSLEACLTSMIYSSRILGMNLAPPVDVTAIFALTGNNVKLSIDMAGRCVWIRLTPKEENPETRTGFRHDDLRGWILTHRAKIVGALMAMVEGWIAAGRPRGGKIFASYEDYSLVLGGILDYCGVPGFLGNLDKLKGSVNTDDDMWRGFYQIWYQKHNLHPVTTKELVALAKEKELLDPIFSRSTTDRGQSTAFGKAIAERLDTILNIDLNLNDDDDEGLSGGRGGGHGGGLHGVKIVQSTISRGLSRYKLYLCGGLEGLNISTSEVQENMDAYMYKRGYYTEENSPLCPSSPPLDSDSQNAIGSIEGVDMGGGPVGGPADGSDGRTDDDGGFIRI